jgi:hypothetical protein
MELLSAQGAMVPGHTDGILDTLLASLFAADPGFVSLLQIVPLSRPSGDDDVFRVSVHSSDARPLASAIGAFGAETLVVRALEEFRSIDGADPEPSSWVNVRAINSAARMARRVEPESSFLESPVFVDPRSQRVTRLCEFRHLLVNSRIDEAAGRLPNEYDPPELLVCVRSVWQTWLERRDLSKLLSFCEHVFPVALMRFEDQALNSTPPILLHLCMSSLVDLLVRAPSAENVKRVAFFLGREGIPQCGVAIAEFLGKLLNEHGSPTPQSSHPALVAAGEFDREQDTALWTFLVSCAANKETEIPEQSFASSREYTFFLSSLAVVLHTQGDRSRCRDLLLQAMERLGLEPERTPFDWPHLATAVALVTGESIAELQGKPLEFDMFSMAGAIRAGKFELALRLSASFDKTIESTDFDDIAELLVANYQRFDGYRGLLTALTRVEHEWFAKRIYLKVIDYLLDVRPVLDLFAGVQDLGLVEKVLWRLLDDHLLSDALRFVQDVSARSCGRAFSRSDVVSLYVLVAAHQSNFGTREDAHATLCEAQALLPSSFSLHMAQALTASREELPRFVAPFIQKYVADLEIGSTRSS